MADELTPAELIATFTRCRNFPRTEVEINTLIQGLIRAAAQQGVECADVVRKCADISEYCPTDADMFRVARDIREEHDRQRQGRPYWSRPEQCHVCHDSGWMQTRNGTYDCSKRCPQGCPVPAPSGHMLTPEVLR